MALLIRPATPITTDTVAKLPQLAREVPGLRPRADSQVTGSDCSGSEGQWNCMTDSFQRCAAGLWSEVMQCAEGTQCTPSGLTYEFAVQYSGGGDGSGVSSGAPGTYVRWVAGVLGGIAVLMMF